MVSNFTYITQVGDLAHATAPTELQYALAVAQQAGITPGFEYAAASVYEAAPRDSSDDVDLQKAVSAANTALTNAIRDMINAGASPSDITDLTSEVLESIEKAIRTRSPNVVYNAIETIQAKAHFATQSAHSAGDEETPKAKMARIEKLTEEIDKEFEKLSLTSEEKERREKAKKQFEEAVQEFARTGSPEARQTMQLAGEELSQAEKDIVVGKISTGQMTQHQAAPLIEKIDQRQIEIHNITGPMRSAPEVEAQSQKRALTIAENTVELPELKNVVYSQAESLQILPNHVKKHTETSISPSAFG